MKKSFLSALMLILAIGANAQNPAEWQKGQEVTENLLWTDYRCDNNENGAKSLIAKLKGRGRLEIRLDDISSNTVAELSFSSPGWKEVEEAVSPDVFKGKHDVYFYFPETRIAQFDEWRFTENLVNGIEAIQIDKKVGKVVAHSLNGQHVSATQNRGLTIIRMPNDQVKKVHLK